MRNDIFEDVVRQISSCQYISDLRAMINRKETSEIIEAVQSMKYTDYSIEQWNEFYQYLFNDKSHYSTQKEVYEALLKRLN